MSATDKAFVGSIPEIYDTYLVPLVFEPYAADLAKRVASTNPKAVLETAAGSGVVPRALAPLLATDARYVVTDLNPLADAAGYSMKDNFFQGAIDVNSHEGKMYWMSYISEPIVPVIAYNKTKVVEMGAGEPNDDWTFAELVDWAKKATKDDVFGYYAADRAYLWDHGRLIVPSSRVVVLRYTGGGLGSITVVHGAYPIAGSQCAVMSNPGQIVVSSATPNRWRTLMLQAR